MAVHVYRIYPAVGIARVGDSDQYYFAPEKDADLHENPTDYSEPPQSGRVYRDNTDAPGKILRQAARFRIFEFTYKSSSETIPTKVKEISSAEWDIEWKVELANKKSFPVGEKPRDHNRMYADARAGQLTLASAQPVRIDRDIPVAPDEDKVNLAELRTDSQGRLIVVPGSGRRGHFHPSTTNADTALDLWSPGWWDDLGDGPVTAKIRPKNTSEPFEKRKVTGAWLVLAPPAYGGPVRHVVTLYDLVLGICYSRLGTVPSCGRRYDLFSFRVDIHPLLHRTSLSRWVSGNAMKGHGPGTRGDYTNDALLTLLGQIRDTDSDLAVTRRRSIFDMIRLPSAEAAEYDALGRPLMPPHPMGPVSVFQYRALQAWVCEPRSFMFDWNPAAPPAPTPLAEVPAELTRCHLSTGTVGFAPGVEVGYEVTLPATWALKPPVGTTTSMQLVTMTNASWDDAFRINTEQISAGGLTASLGVPWQVDLFDFCVASRTIGNPPLDHGLLPIWPGARPHEVVTRQHNEERPWGFAAETGVVLPKEAVYAWNKLGFVRKVGSEYLDDERDGDYPRKRPR